MDATLAAAMALANSKQGGVGSVLYDLPQDRIGGIVEVYELLTRLQCLQPCGTTALWKSESPHAWSMAA